MNAMKNIKKTSKFTIISNLSGLLMIICCCVFTILSFSNLMLAIEDKCFEYEVVIKIFAFMLLAIVCLILSFMSFVAEIYKSLSAVEKCIDNEQREN